MTKHNYPWQNPDGTFKDQSEANNIEEFHGSYSPEKHKALEALRGTDEKIEMDKIQELENEQFDSLMDDLNIAEKQIKLLKEEIEEDKFGHALEVSNLDYKITGLKQSNYILIAGIVIVVVFNLFF